MSAETSKETCHGGRRNADFAWVAGIIEGEGYIRLPSAKRPWSMSVEVKMTDEDVVRRCHELMGIGYVYGPIAPAGRSIKQSWVWMVQLDFDVVGLLMTLYPFFGERRQARARRVLLDWRQRPINPHWIARREATWLARADAKQIA